MKKYAFLVMTVLALVVFASGCIDDNTTNQSSQPTIPTKDYSGNGVSFSYPENWQELSTKGGYNLVGFVDPDSFDSSANSYNTVVAIQSVAIPSGSTLKQYYDSTYANFKAKDTSFQQISDTTTTVDGTTAYVNTHLIDVNGVQKKEKAVWFERNGNAYIILCGALPEEFDGQQKYFDAIINTFRVQ